MQWGELGEAEAEGRLRAKYELRAKYSLVNIAHSVIPKKSECSLNYTL